MNIFTYFNSLFNYISQTSIHIQTNNNEITNTNTDEIVNISCNIINISQICLSDIEIDVFDEIENNSYTQYSDSNTNTYELKSISIDNSHYNDAYEDQIYQRHYTQFFKN